MSPDRVPARDEFACRLPGKTNSRVAHACHERLQFERIERALDQPHFAPGVLIPGGPKIEDRAAFRVTTLGTWQVARRIAPRSLTDCLASRPTQIGHLLACG